MRFKRSARLLQHVSEEHSTADRRTLRNDVSRRRWLAEIDPPMDVMQSTSVGTSSRIRSTLTRPSVMHAIAAIEVKVRDVVKNTESSELN